jgi:hypothetical protein
MQSVNPENEVSHIAKRIITLRITNCVTVPEAKTGIQEEWREIGFEYPGYSVSSLGQIKGLKGKIFKANLAETDMSGVRL